jgi:lipopolysaccharide transport system permease protein
MSHKLVLEAGRTERQYWRDLWRYRELFYFLAWRDFMVRYKQTLVGVSWSLIRPVLTMTVLALTVKLINSPTGGAPAALFIFAAMLPWQFFSTAMSESGTSLINNSNLISKIYFPRLVMPVSAVIVTLADFLISLAFMAVLFLVFRYAPPWQIVFLPLFMLMVFAASVGTGLWMAALMVKYRDVRFILQFVVQFGLYASPVMIMSSTVMEKVGKHYEGYGALARIAYSLNPAVGIIDGFRYCLLRGPDHAIYWPGMMVSLVVVGLLLMSGLWYFRRTERTFADNI